MWKACAPQKMRGVLLWMGDHRPQPSETSSPIVLLLPRSFCINDDATFATNVKSLE